MVYLLVLIPATALTIAGYFVLFLSARTEGTLRTFGKYLGFWAFTLAGLLILGALFAAAHGFGAHGGWYGGPNERWHGGMRGGPDGMGMDGMHGGMRCPMMEEGGPHATTPQEGAPKQSNDGANPPH